MLSILSRFSYTYSGEIARISLIFRNSAISTVKMMHLNQARMTGYRSFEGIWLHCFLVALIYHKIFCRIMFTDQLKMAEVVDSFILDTHLYHSTNETVSNILKLFSKRCIHWNGVLNADQVDRLIKVNSFRNFKISLSPSPSLATHIMYYSC